MDSHVARNYQVGCRSDPIRRLFECGSLTFCEKHIVVVVKSPREDEALKFYITFDEMVFKGRENRKL